MKHNNILDTIANGQLTALLEDAYHKVMQNIANDNTSPNLTRKIGIQIKIKPQGKTRANLKISANVDTKLAPVIAGVNKVYCGNEIDLFSETENSADIFDTEGEVIEVYGDVDLSGRNLL